MKALTKFFAIYLLFTIFLIADPGKLKAQNADVSFQVFYDDLSPYGQWIDYPGHGYAWVPSAGRDFVPYATAGHWVWTEYGWTWVSDYSWGWGPFHYGRWDDDDYYGWVWIPDDRYLGRNDIHNYYRPRNNNETYMRNSTTINNTYADNSRHATYLSGPKREDVQKITGRQINPVTIRENPTPGQKLNNNQLNIYRPSISKTNGDVRPSKVAERKDVNGNKSANNNGNQPGQQVPQQKNQQPVHQQRQPVQQQPQQQKLPQQQTQPVHQQRQPKQQVPQQQNQPVQQQRQPRQQVPQQQPVQQQRQPRQQLPQQQTQPVHQQRQPRQQVPQQQPVQQQRQPRQQVQQQQPVHQDKQPRQQVPQQQPVHQDKQPQQQPQQNPPGQQPPHHK